MREKARGRGVCGLEMHEATGNNKKKCTAKKEAEDARGQRALRRRVLWDEVGQKNTAGWARCVKETA